MVLTNTLLVGLILVLVCTSSCVSEPRRNRPLSEETTTISVKTTKADTKNYVAGSTAQNFSTTTSKPKTDLTNNKTAEQTRSRGSTKYADYAESTTEAARGTTTVPKQIVQESRNSKQTTIRNDRSLSINTDKYNSPEFHSENNIYPENQNVDKKYVISVDKEKITTQKPWDRGNFAEFSTDLTTPKNELFDSKYKRMQEDITKSFAVVLTTPKYDIMDERYKEIQESMSKFVEMELTTPKNDVNSDSFERIRQDISKSLDANVDKFFDENKRNEEAENIEKPELQDPKIDYTRFRSIEAIESKDKNKIHKDFNKESGLQMKLTSDYNNSQIIDAPGVVLNAIPVQKDVENAKKADLEQGETKIERISIEKPEKDPGGFINNKIENELVNLLVTEGPEEKPIEHKNIYLSKRGSTVQEEERTIEKTLSTESGIPMNLYPYKTSTVDLEGVSFLLNNVDNGTIISKSTKKEKLSNRTAKKELEVSPTDLDNKIPKFLPLTTSQNNQIEATTLRLHSVEVDESSSATTEAFFDASGSSTQTDVPTSTYVIESSENPSENTGTTEKSNFYEAFTGRDFTAEFFEATADSTTLSSITAEDTTIYTDVTMEEKLNLTAGAIDEQTERINSMQDNIGESEDASDGEITNGGSGDITSTTVKVTTQLKASKSVDLDKTVISSNDSKSDAETTENMSANVLNNTREEFSTTASYHHENVTKMDFNTNIWSHTTEHFNTTEGYNYENLTKIDVNTNLWDHTTEYFNTTKAYNYENVTKMDLSPNTLNNTREDFSTSQSFHHENVTKTDLTTNTLNNTTEDFSTTENHNYDNKTKMDASDTKVKDDKSDTTPKKNESVSSIINEITKPPPSSTATKSVSAQWDGATENVIQENLTQPVTDSDQAKQNEINTNNDRIVSDECENLEDGDDYGEHNCKTHNTEDGNEPDVDLEDNNGQGQSVFTEDKRLTTSSSVVSTAIPNTNSTTETPVTTTISTTSTTTSTARITTSSTTVTTTPADVIVPVSHDNRQINTDEDTTGTPAESDGIVGSEDEVDDGGNGGKIAAIVISTIGGICLLLLVALLVVMKKRQKRFNYGQRCRPVSLDAYSMDNVSIHNSTRRKGVLMTSKRSYGNPAFEDPTSPSHMLNFSELLKFANNQEGIKGEFDKIPQVTTKTNELPEGCDVKNRYANVIPLPETRVFLSPIEGVPSSDYINANFVTGPQGARNYYIACQAPMQNTIEDFWRMIWEQQSKVILMLTHLYENGVEKCIDYLPPSEVLDCHRLFGDYQVTLKKREVKDKYIISSLQLKNMVSNSWREVTHLWYMGWPEKGVPDEANSLVAFLIEARSSIKIGENKVKETNNANISNGLMQYANPVVVHCSPGTGRTGTVIACDIAVREFELARKVDIPRTVYRIRRDRASAVQTKEQYAFIYKVIHFYATKLTGGLFESF